MHIQLIEPYFGGHHTNYIEALVQAFGNQLASKQFSAVTITVTPTHHQHLIKEGIAANITSAGITLDPSFPEISPAPTLLERYQLFKAINAAVQRVKPNSILVPSADYDVMINALFKWQAVFGKNTNIPAIGIFHYGTPVVLTTGFKEKLKQWVYEKAWQYSGWNKLLMVNPVVYEDVIRRNDAIGQKASLLPDPVPATLDLDASAARVKLGLPKDKLLVGFVGMMDERKAIPEILSAFDAADFDDEVTMVLAGQLATQYAELIETTYQHLISTGKLILINRYLSQGEVQMAYSAMDIIALLQYKRANLSANLLKAMVYDKPLIADDFGYTGMMLKRFSLGYPCDVQNNDSVKAALKNAVDNVDKFKVSSHSNKLKTFHRVDNFANMIISALSGCKTEIPVVTWDEVCEGLGE